MGMSGYASVSDGKWECCCALPISGYLNDLMRYDLGLFEAVLSIGRKPLTVFVSGDWRYYWRMGPDEVRDRLMVADIMED